ncbi:MAG: isoprenylcysteine carboxylmethyltransferase family protein [Burkholderiaceae bacterium]
MISIVFVIGTLAATTLLLLSIAGLLLPRFQFWPPPQRASWQHRVFWALFRTMFVSIVLLCVLDYRGIGPVASAWAFAGWTLVLVGFGLATLVTAKLGWQDAHGEANQLKTEGWFSWSRNPIYVFTFVGMIGLVIAVNSWYVNGLIGLWAVMYLLAPYAEEPWLEKAFGEEYREYAAKVPRFIGRIR